tara:strand:- start:311 stop:493 length:183 start_codon:yes stop_codon:yes gene_type:complete
LLKGRLVLFIGKRKVPHFDLLSFIYSNCFMEDLKKNLLGLGLKEGEEKQFIRESKWKSLK